jgi:hypothetical protein
MKLWCDKKSIINIVNNPMQYDKLLELGHIATREQVTDCVIKELSSLNLIRLCDKMGLMNLCNKMDLMDFFVPLRGNVSNCLIIESIYEY